MKKLLIILTFLFVLFSVKAQTVLTVEGQTLTDMYTAAHTTNTTFTFRNNSLAVSSANHYMLNAGNETNTVYNNYLNAAVITGNKFTFTGSDAGTHGILVGYNINDDIRYNFIDKAPYGVVTKSGTTNMTWTTGAVAYNVIKNPGVTGVTVKGINGVRIYNNTFYHTVTALSGLIFIEENDSEGNAPSVGTKIYNNIFYTKRIYDKNIFIQDVSCQSGFESDYNVFYCAAGTPYFAVGATQYTFAQWQALGYDLHSVVINPNFADTLSCVPTARLDYGTTLATTWNTGLATNATWTVGNAPLTTAQNGTWQVGAYVFAATGGGGGEEVTGTTYYVSTTGSNSNPGTFAQPWKDWSYCMNGGKLKEGDRLYVRGGTYRTTGSNSSTTHVWISGNAGTSTNPIRIENYPGEVPIFNLGNIATTQTYGFALNISNNTYLTIKGLRVTGWLQPGVAKPALVAYFLTGGSNVTIENCTADHIGGYGFSLSNTQYPYIKNCDAYLCSDANGSGTGGAFENANGFGVTGGTQLNSSDNVTFEGCRAWNCSDDGWDFYGVNAYITIKNCWAFWNGYGLEFASQGNGQGFKVGPNYTTAYNGTVRRVIYNSMAIRNKAQGFDRNYGEMSGSTCRMDLFNNFSYDNGQYGYKFDNAANAVDIFRNNTTLNNDVGTYILSAGATHDHNSWNGAVTFTTADLASIDTSQLDNPRQADGSLPILTFGHLVSGSDLRGAGVQITTPVAITTDGDNRLYANPPDMGPFQYGASSTILTTALTISAAGNATTISTYHGTLQFSVASITPSNATDQTVNWSIVNGTGSGSISSAGLLTAITNGTVTVYAQAHDGSGALDSKIITISNQVVAGYATVTTTGISTPTKSTVIAGGNVTADGGSDVTEKGICYSTSPNPTIADTHISAGTGVGTFTIQLSGLTSPTTYHIRAYATNSTGTSYGADISFITKKGRLIYF